MRISVTLLRLSGLFIILMDILNTISQYNALSAFLFNIQSITALLYSLTQGIVLGLICFGVAAALVRLDKLNERIERAASRRRVMPQPRDVAPVAPNWSTPLDPPRVEVTPGFKPQRRIDRQQRTSSGYEVGDPLVRQAPHAIRVTPGAEDQYADDDPMVQRVDYLARQEPRPTKEILRLSRDAQIKRKQSGQ